MLFLKWVWKENLLFFFTKKYIFCGVLGFVLVLSAVYDQLFMEFGEMLFGEIHSFLERQPDLTYLLVGILDEISAPQQQCK